MRGRNIRRSSSIIAFALVLLFSYVGLTGCGQGEDFDQLKQFQTCEELNKYIQWMAARELDERYFGTRDRSWGGFGVFGASAMDNAVGAEPSVARASNGGNAPGGQGAVAKQKSGSNNTAPAKNYSQTNNQVAGVDEADFVKNDGKHIYVVSKNYLMIYKAWPIKDVREVGRYKLSFTPTEMHLFGDKIVLFTKLNHRIDNDSAIRRRGWDGPMSEPGMPKRGAAVQQLPPETNTLSQRAGRPLNGTLTRVTILDTSNKANPKTLRELFLEGEYKTSRRVGRMVRMVTYSRLNLPKPALTTNELNRLDSYKRRELERAAIKKAKAQSWLPLYQDTRYTNDKAGTPQVQKMCGCARFFRPSQTAGRGVLTVVSIDLDNPNKNIADTGIISNYGHVYASKQNLYVATIPGAGDASAPKNSSAIHKFDISQAGSPASYKASGVVPGFILNQFAMDEHKGFLRVATTTRTERFFSDRDTGNNVFVLGQADDTLGIVGAVRDLAKGERIYSARFNGDRGYIVTFRQIDPLFTFDLKDPKAPKQVGELKIPGYSTYIHPVGENHLLTIGMDGEFDTRNGVEGGRLTGKIQLTIFDVSNMANPVQAHKHVIDTKGWGSSEALHNHKAFTYFAHKKMLAIPVSVMSHDKMAYGARLFNIDVKKGISVKGDVDHSAFLPKDDIEKRYEEYKRYGNIPQVRRGIFYEDFFYSISTHGIKLNAIDQLSKTIRAYPFP